MAIKIFKENDVDLNLIKSKTVAIIGYGNQARAQALNLKESGISNIIIGLRKGSHSLPKAKEEGFEVKRLEEVANMADVIMMLAPDETHGQIYENYLKSNMKVGAALGFSHGFSIRFGLVKPRIDIDVIMIAPKGPGHTLRQLYLKGLGMPSLIGVEQDFTSHAEAIALSYAGGIGSHVAGILKSSFAEECESDLFSEQTILCGGVPALIKAGFETLVEEGFSPEVAYIECLHEVKQIADLLWEGGYEKMASSISNTAEYGGYLAGETIVTNEVKAMMKQNLKAVRAGNFAKAFMKDVENESQDLKARRIKEINHPIEGAGKIVRGMMPWLGKK